MAYFLRNGSSFTVTDEANMDLHERLPVGNYIVRQDPFGKLFLEQVDPFEAPKKIYGDVMRNVDRIMRTFDDRTASTGVMLTGEKGSGKTLLSKMLSMEGAKRAELPTIIINTPFTGDNFNKFMQDINQPCIILFDEFEKVYDRDDQQAILTLLDGVFPSKKLFILTCNDKWRVDEHMRNRPGRIYYMLDFTGLDQNFIREYCQENLKSTEQTDTLCKIANMFYQFNFDMLKSMVEEMNRYGETPQEALRILNVKAEFSGAVKYKVDLKVPNKDIDLESVAPGIWSGNPLNPDHGTIDIEFYTGKGDDAEWHEIEFRPKDLRKVQDSDGSFIFVTDQGQLTLTRVQDAQIDFWRAF